jgi:hypothetical protein
MQREDGGSVRLELEGPIFVLIEDWRRSQRKIPSRADAIRQLIQRALDATTASTAEDTRAS